MLEYPRPPALQSVGEGLARSISDHDLTGSIVVARTEVEGDPASVAAWLRLGMLYDVHGLFVEASGAYGRAIQLSPRDPRLAYFRAFVVEQGGFSGREIEVAYRRAMQLAPDYGSLHVRWAEYLLHESRLAEAKRAFEKAIAILPAEESARARRGLGLTLLALGDAAGGVAALRSVIVIRADDGPTWSGLARGYHQLGMEPDALLAAERSKGLEDHLGYFDTWRLAVLEEAVTPLLVEERIMAKMGMGRSDDALADALQWERRHPDWPSIKRFIGNLYRDLGREDMAQQYFDAATRLVAERYSR